MILIAYAIVLNVPADFPLFHVEAIFSLFEDLSDPVFLASYRVVAQDEFYREDLSSFEIDVMPPAAHYINAATGVFPCFDLLGVEIFTSLVHGKGFPYICTRNEAVVDRAEVE